MGAAGIYGHGTQHKQWAHHLKTRGGGKEEVRRCARLRLRSMMVIAFLSVVAESQHDGTRVDGVLGILLLATRAFVCDGNDTQVVVVVVVGAFWFCLRFTLAMAVGLRVRGWLACIDEGPWRWRLLLHDSAGPI